MTSNNRHRIALCVFLKVNVSDGVELKRIAERCVFFTSDLKVNAQWFKLQGAPACV